MTMETSIDAENTTDFRSEEMTTLTPGHAANTTGFSYDETELFIPWNNPHNVISVKTLFSFEKVVACGVNLILFSIGVPTNLLNCLVFYRQGLRDRMNLCLFSLALVDLLYITFFYLIGSYCLVGQLLPEVEEWLKYFMRKYFTGLYRGFLYSSGCLTTVIAVERCLCVTLPLKAATLVKTRTIAVIIVGVVVLIQVVCLLYPFELSIDSREDPHTGKITVFLTTTEFYFQHKVLYDVVENTFLMIVIPFTTFTVVTIATAITVVQLKRAIAWRHGSSTSAASDAREMALVKMLVVVSLIYIASTAPNIALGLTKLLVLDFNHTQKYANIFVASHLMYLVIAQANSSVNFYVYLFRSSRFRQELHSLLRLCKIQCGKPPGARRLCDTTMTAAKRHNHSESGGVHA